MATASPASTRTNAAPSVDALFGKKVQPDKYAPTVPPESLAAALIVRYMGEQIIEYKKDGEDRRAKKQLFASRGGEGRWFSVFGSPNLNSQLRKVRTGGILLVKYRGKEPDELQRDVHVWDVAESTATLDQVRALRATPAWVEREESFELEFQVASDADKERMNTRRAAPPEPPPHTDDDLPF